MLVNHIQNPNAPSDYRVPPGVFQMLCGVWLLEFTGLNGENSFYTFNWGEESNCGRCRAIFDGMRRAHLVGFDLSRLAVGLPMAILTSLPGIGDTISKFKGPISEAAGKVSDSLAPGTGKIATSLFKVAIPDPKNPQAQRQAQQHVQAVRHAATTNAHAANALNHAQSTAANTAIVYHMTQMLQRAKAGDPTAQAEITAVQQRADAGDSIAQSAMKALHMVQRRPTGSGASSLLSSLRPSR